MKKKKVIIGSGIAATAVATVVGAATWIIGGMVYDGTVGKSRRLRRKICLFFTLSVRIRY